MTTLSSHEVYLVRLGDGLGGQFSDIEQTDLSCAHGGFLLSALMVRLWPPCRIQFRLTAERRRARCARDASERCEAVIHLIKGRQFHFGRQISADGLTLSKEFGHLHVLGLCG